MEYACIGERLGHSFSAEVHSALGDYEYELCELSRDELGDFLEKRDFRAINVTIPYKEAVIPYLTEIDEAARAIGAVNTVVNKDGKLYGFNTDFYGMCRLIEHAGISVTKKKAVILGTGGTSKTAESVLRALGAGEIIKVSRTPTGSSASYAELYGEHSDAEIIINTTPVGMFPQASRSPVDISGFTRLSGVIDAVYNPQRSTLVLDALERGLRAEGGLYMLVAQAVSASEIFLDKKYPRGKCDRVYEEILRKKQNLVLIGMPSSGKTSVGELIAEELGLPFFDTDALIEEKISMSISEYFSRFGEEKFREREAEVIEEISAESAAVIATGGGAVLRRENIKNLKKNGKIFFLDRPLEELTPTSDRPTAMSKEAIERRYRERYDLYKSTADVHIFTKTDIKSTAEEVIKNR